MNEQLYTAAEAALRRAGVLRRGAVLLVALSGGADSVALLLTVRALAEKHGLAVRAAHVEHGLRGAESLADAHFCRELCQRLGVPFTCDHAALAGGMDAAGAEARARGARYALLLERARECRADALLLAHHRDDQAETVLARLLRGGGARGLGGMREVSARGGVTIVRPLLAVSKQAILAALGSQPYREDGSNARPCCQRNRLRAEVLPLLEKENPRVREHLAQSAKLLQMDEDCLAAQAEKLLQKAFIDRPPFFCIAKPAFLGAPEAVALRALRRFAERGMALLAAQDGLPAPEERSLSAEDSLKLLALLFSSDGDTLNLPHGLRACVTARYLHIVRMADGSPVIPAAAPPPVGKLPGRRTVRFGMLTFRLTPYNPVSDPPPDGLRSVAVPDAVLAGATLRAARPGDRIRPFGADGGKPLRRYLIDRKTDAPFRPFVPVLCAGSEALWAAGVGAAEATRVTDQPATLLTVRGPMPWLPEPPKKTVKSR